MPISDALTDKQFVTVESIFPGYIDWVREQALRAEILEHTPCPSHGCVCTASLVTNNAIGRCSDSCDDLSPCTGFGCLPRHPVTMFTDDDNMPKHEPNIMYRIFDRECFWESTTFFNQRMLPRLRGSVATAHVHVLASVPTPRSASPELTCWFCQSPDHLQRECPEYKAHERRVCLLAATSSNPNSNCTNVAANPVPQDVDDKQPSVHVNNSSVTRRSDHCPSKKRTLAMMQCTPLDRPGSPGTPPGSPPPSPVSSPDLDSPTSSNSSTPTLFERFSATRRANMRRDDEESSRGFDRSNCDRHH